MNKKTKLFIILYFIGYSAGFSQENHIKKGLDVISKQSSQAILIYLASDYTVVPVFMDKKLLRNWSKRDSL